MTINARFDGRVIIPDKPLNLPPNQALIIQIQPLESTEEFGGSALNWLAANSADSDTIPPDLAHRHDHYLYGRSEKDNDA